MGVNVERASLNAQECVSLAELTKEVRIGTVIENDDSYESHAKNIESMSKDDRFQIFVAFDSTGEVLGWTYDYVGFPLMTFISGFCPIVKEEYDNESVAVALIEAEKSRCKETERTRLEIEMILHSEEHKDLSKHYLKWYEECGFQYAAEEAHMKAYLPHVDLPSIEIPNGFEIKKFSQVANEELVDAGYKTFENGNDELFVSMTRAEQNITLEHFFDKSISYLDESSPILVRDGEVVGFVITRMKNKVADIGPVGLIPGFRGKGLGSYLLVHSLKSLKETNVETAVLDMSRSNELAHNLYTKYGFVDEYYKLFYSWAP